MDLGAVHAVQYKLGLAEIFLFPFPLYFVYKVIYCKYIVNPSRPLVSLFASAKVVAPDAILFTYRSFLNPRGEFWNLFRTFFSIPNFFYLIHG